MTPRIRAVKRADITIHEIPPNSSYTIEEVGETVMEGVLNEGCSLAETLDFGTVMVSPDERDLYLIPPDVLRWLVEQGFIYDTFTATKQ